MLLVAAWLFERAGMWFGGAYRRRCFCVEQPFASIIGMLVAAGGEPPRTIFTVDNRFFLVVLLFCREAPAA